MCVCVCARALKCGAQLQGDVSSEVMALRLAFSGGKPAGPVVELERRPQIVEERDRKQFVVLSLGVKCRTPPLTLYISI